MSARQQYISLIPRGGVGVTLADAKGTPFATTGEGAVVFQRNPILIDPVFQGDFRTDRVHTVEMGSPTVPAVQIGPEATGLYAPSTDALGITVAGQDVGKFINGGLILTGGITYTGQLSGPYHTPLQQEGDLYVYSGGQPTRLGRGSVGTTLQSTASGIQWSPAGSGSGTVTSVGTVAGELVGGPITTFGNLGLASTGVVNGTYGSGTQVAVLAIDVKGRITNASQATVNVAGALGYTPAPINSPAFTGVPTGPTAAVGTNTTQLATTAFVQAALANLPEFYCSEYGMFAGNTAVNNTTALNNTKAAAGAAGGGRVMLSQGNCAVDPFTVSDGNNITIVGQGRYGGSTLSFSNATGDSITLSTWAHLGLENFDITSSVRRTGGNAIKVTGACFTPHIRDLRIEYHYDGINIESGSENFVENVTFRYMYGGRGVKVGGTAAGIYRTTLAHIRCDNPYPTGTFGTVRTYAGGTNYTVGQIVNINSKIWQCSVGGLTAGGASTPNAIPGSTAADGFTAEVIDGTCRWKFVSQDQLMWVLVDSNAYSTFASGIVGIGGRHVVYVADTLATGTSHPIWMWFEDVEGDHNYMDNVVLAGGEGFRAYNSWLGSSLQGNGITIGPSFKGEVTLDTTRIAGAWLHGVLWYPGPASVKIVTCDIGHNSVSGVSNAHGIFVNGGVTQGSITNCVIGPLAVAGWAGSANNQGYAIWFNTGATSNVIVDNNDLRGNQLGAVNNLSSGSILFGLNAGLAVPWLTDAPSNGSTYGRNNGAWVTVGGGGAPSGPAGGDLAGSYPNPTLAWITRVAGKSLTLNNTLTLAGTDGSTLNIGAGGTLGTAAFTAASAYQTADNTLTQLSLLSGVGAIVASATDTFAMRGIGVTNANDLLQRSDGDSRYLTPGTASTTYMPLAGGTFTGKVTTLASAAGGAGLNFPHGAAPSSPVNGDVWTTSVGLFARINGANVGPFVAGSFQPLDTGLSSLAALAGTVGVVEQTGSEVFGIRLVGVANATDLLTRAGGDGRYQATGAAAGGDLTGTYPNPTLAWISRVAGKTLTLSNTLTLAGTDGSTLNVGAGGTLGTAAFTAASAYQPAGSYQAADAGLTSLAGLSGIGVVTATGTDVFAMRATGVANATDILTRADGDGRYLTPATAASTYMPIAGGTFTGKVTTLATAAGGAGLNLPHGTAPTTPTNGDMWTTTAGVFARVNGATVGPFGAGGGGISDAPSDGQTYGRNNAAWVTVGGGGAPTGPAGGDLAGSYPNPTLAWLTRTAGKSLAVAAILTLAGTDGSTLNIGAGGTLGSAAYTASTAYQAAGASAGGDLTGTYPNPTFGWISRIAGKTFTLNNTLTLSGTDGSTLNVGAGGTLGSAAFTASTAYQAAGAAAGGDLTGSYPNPTLGWISRVAGKTLTLSNTLTFAGTDGSTLNVGAGGTLGSAAFTPSTNYQAADNTLTQLSNLSGAGAIVASATDTFAMRTLGVANATDILTRADGDGRYLTPATAASTYAPIASPTFTGKATTAASAAGGAGLNLPHGAAPTSPANGDVWTTTGGVFWRINGATQQVTMGGPYQASDAGLSSLAAIATTGLVEATGTDTFSTRAIGVAAGTDILTRADGDGRYLTPATAASTYLALAGGTLTGKLTTLASAAGGSGFVLPHGAAPTSPNNGDLWTTTAGLFARINGATVGPYGTGGSSGITINTTTIAGGTSGRLLYDNAGTVGEAVAIGLNVGMPATAGMIASLLGANNITGFSMNRFTDTAPTGNFLDFRTAAGGSLFKVQADGQLVGTQTWNGTDISLSGGYSGVSVNLSSFVAAPLVLTQAASSPQQKFFATANPTDQKYWWITEEATAGILTFQSINDAQAVVQGQINFYRDGKIAGVAPATGDSSTYLATTAFVQVAMSMIPQNIQAGNYAPVLADAGKHIYHASGAGAGDTYTIPANATVAYPIGTTLTFINDDSNTLAIGITTDTLVLSPGTTTGTRTLAQGGMATAIKVTSTRWVISGTGLT